MTTYAYLRVSSRKQTGRQKTDSQKTSISRFCRFHSIKRPKWVEDYQSGRRDDRDGFQSILRDAVEGDTLLVWKLDRCGRSMIDTVRNLQTLIGRKVKIVITSTGMTFDSDDAMSTFLMQLFSALAELESSTTSERIRAGLEHAKSKGVKLGRKPNERKRQRIQKWMEQGVPISTIATRLSITRQSVHATIRRMRKDSTGTTANT